MGRGLLSDDEVFAVPETELPIQGAEPDVVYYLRSLTLQDIGDARKRNTRWRRQVEETDWVKAQLDMLDKALVRWEGITDHGEPAECSRAAKAKLPPLIQGALVERAQMGAEESSPAESFRESA